MKRAPLIVVLYFALLSGAAAAEPPAVADQPGGGAAPPSQATAGPSKGPAELEAAGVSPERLAEGSRRFRHFCAPCHLVDVPAGPQPRRGSLPAPPAFALADHYAKAIADPRQRIDAIVAFVRSPLDEREAVLMPGAVRRFGPMAPMPLPEALLRDIAAYLALADFEPPAWYEEHYRQEHGPGPRAR